MAELGPISFEDIEKAMRNRAGINRKHEIAIMMKDANLEIPLAILTRVDQFLTSPIQLEKIGSNTITKEDKMAAEQFVNNYEPDVIALLRIYLNTIAEHENYPLEPVKIVS